MTDTHGVRRQRSRPKSRIAGRDCSAISNPGRVDRKRPSTISFCRLVSATTSPTTGRFVTRDPIGQAGGVNEYGYVGGDPVNWGDPSGLRGHRHGYGGLGVPADEQDFAEMPIPENINPPYGVHRGPFWPPPSVTVQDMSFALPFGLGKNGNTGFAPVFGTLTPVSTGTDHPAVGKTHCYGGFGGGLFPGGFSAMQTEGPVNPGTYWQFTGGFGAGFAVSINQKTGERSWEYGFTTKGAWFGVVTVR
jgi:hypothetical protein